MQSNTGDTTDQSVISAVLNGNANAFALLIDRYQNHVFMIVSAHIPHDDSAEVAHEIFIRAYRSLGGYKPRRPFRHWLSTIAVRSCCDYWRQRYRRRETPASDLSANGCKWLETALTPRSEEVFEASARQHEARQLLELVMDSIQPMDRMVLTLSYLEERPVKEVAELLGISSANVKIRSFRAKRKLKKVLHRHGIKGGDHDA